MERAMKRLLGIGVLMLIGLVLVLQSYRLGQEATNSWWIRRLTGKEFSVKDSKLREDVYCVRIQTGFPNGGFVAQPEPCAVNERKGIDIW